MLLNVLEDNSDEKKAVEREYLHTTDGSKGIIELLQDSKETASNLEGCLARVLRKAERANTSLTSRTPTDTFDNKSHVKLPKLNLPVFDGNILCWQEFWEIFSISVHEQNILSFFI